MPNDPNQKYVSYGFLTICLLSVFTNFGRSDFNLVIFAFAYILWEDTKQRVRMYYMIVFSLLIDIIWTIYWSAYWNQDVFSSAWSNGIHTFIIVLSIIIIILKVIDPIISFQFVISGYLFVTDDSLKHVLAPSGFIQNVNYVFGINSHTQMQET